MTCPAKIRAVAAALAILALAAVPARALVTLNDGTDKIYVSGTWSMGYDTNISASSDNTSDTTTSASASIEYQRRAGMIGVNANINFTLNRFLRNTTYDNLDPAYSLEFDKSTGRTTGTLNLNAVRSSQTDAAVNLYTTSWNYNASLNLHYPVIDRYSLAGTLSYGLLDYTKTSGQPLVNLSTYSSSLSLFYILSEQRDLFASYNYSYQESSSSTSTTDDGLNLGVHGKVFWEINGSLSVGYMIRDPHGIVAADIAAAAVAPEGSITDLTASASLNWNFNRKLAFTGSLSKSLSTTATDATTDTLAASLDATYSINARLSAATGIGGGENRFFGPGGLLMGTDVERRDYYFTWNANVSYTFSERLHASLSYAYFKNWSNLGFATFVRNSLTLTLSSRW